MPPDDQPSPATLRPEVGTGDGGAGYNGAQRPIISTKEQGKDAVLSAKQEWQDFQLEHGAIISGGKVVVPKVAKESTSTGLMTIGDDGEASGGTSGDWSTVGQNLYNRWQVLESDNAQFLKDSGVGAGRFYVATEGDKQDEVTRQFKDFLARAKGTYDLMDSEQSYGMAIDDQNIQNETAMRAGVLDPSMTPHYFHTTGPGLSSVIRPSLPNYLSPDYRMNQAVGLGGGEGFNDPQYDENGMPLYATGTDPMGDPALANIPPDLLAMVGKEMGVPFPDAPPDQPWPWGRVA